MGFRVHKLSVSKPYPVTRIFTKNLISSIYSYDAEADPDFAIIEFLQNKAAPDAKTGVTKALAVKWKTRVQEQGRRKMKAAL